MDSLPVKVKALYNYDKAEENEISLIEGETYTISEKDGDWWMAEDKDGNKGLVPSNYVEIVKEKSKVKICKLCGEKLGSSYVTGGDHLYHSACFFCKKCEKNLSGKPFIKKDDAIYCEECYTSIFSPKCALCNEVLSGEYINALDQNWHPDHFVCCDCGQPFKSNSFRKYDDKPYCEECFEKNFVLQCSKCDKSIRGKLFEINDLKLHPECFVCEEDNAPISQTDHFHITEEENKIYCEKHYAEKFLHECFKCKKKITKRFISASDRYFHMDCWRCYECDKSLLDSSFVVNDKLFLCTEHGNSEMDSKTSNATRGEDKSYVESQEELKNLVLPYKELVKKSHELPNGIVYSRREDYLSTKEFEELFKMSREEFNRLTLWRQRDMKRKVNLF